MFIPLPSPTKRYLVLFYWAFWRNSLPSGGRWKLIVAKCWPTYISSDKNHGFHKSSTLWQDSKKICEVCWENTGWNIFTLLFRNIKKSTGQMSLLYLTQDNQLNVKQIRYIFTLFTGIQGKKGWEEITTWDSICSRWDCSLELCA